MWARPKRTRQQGPALADVAERPPFGFATSAARTLLLAEAMERLEPAPHGGDASASGDAGARAIAWSVLALAVVSALAESTGLPSGADGWLRWRGLAYAVAALAQVALQTRTGSRFSRLLRAAVPAAVAVDVALSSALPEHRTVAELGIRAALLAVSALLPWSARWALRASIGFGVVYAAVLAATGPLAGIASLAAALPRPLARAITGAGTAILVVVGAALAAWIGERGRRTREALVAAVRRQQAFAALATLGLESADAAALTERAVAGAAEALGVEACAVFALDADGKALAFRAGVGWSQDGAGKRLKAGERTLARCVLDAGEAVVFPDLAREERFAVPRWLKDRGVVSGAGVVVPGGAQPFGILVAFASRRWTCGADERAFLSELAGVLATAVGHLDAKRTLANEAHVAATLVRVGRELLTSVDTSVLLERACALTADAVGADHSQTWLLDPEEEAYVPVSAHGLDQEAWKAIRALRVRAGSMTPLLNRIVQEGAIEVMPAAHRHPYLETVLVQFGIGRALVAPVHRGDDVVGLQLSGRGVDAAAFTTEQARIASGVARLASIALANARLVETAEHASQLKSEFLSTMSHELRTPLNVIIGYLDMLADEPASPEHAEILARVRSSSVELLDMIEGTLNLNRIEAGQDIPQLAEIAVDELLDELRGEFAVYPRKTDAVLRWLPGQGALLYTDRRRLKIILKNLVGNAIKFTAAGEVVVSSEMTPRGCTFTVRDTGIGIPATHLPVIFDMFRQVDSSESRSYSGAGLGLYIVKRLLDQLGGTVEVHSEPGRGSTFRVALPNEPVACRPAAAESAIAANGGARASGAEARVGASAEQHIGDAQGNARRTAELVDAALPKAHRKQRVLYADDLELNRHLLRRFIARHLPDVEFFEASDGLHALAVFEAHRPDLVLLDLRMPKMDGWVAARRMRELEGGREVPILAVTVTASPGAEAYALHSGCNEFITKPISDYGVLLSRIEYWLGRDSRPGAPVRFDAGDGRAARPPRSEPSSSELVCVLCNQPLPSTSVGAYEKRRKLTAQPVARA